MTIENLEHPNGLQYETSEMIRCFSDVGDYEALAWETGCGWCVLIMSMGFDHEEQTQDPELLLFDHVEKKQEALDLLNGRIAKLQENCMTCHYSDRLAKWCALQGKDTIPCHSCFHYKRRT